MMWTNPLREVNPCKMQGALPQAPRKRHPPLGLGSLALGAPSGDDAELRRTLGQALLDLFLRRQRLSCLSLEKFPSALLDA